MARNHTAIGFVPALRRSTNSPCKLSLRAPSTDAGERASSNSITNTSVAFGGINPGYVREGRWDHEAACPAAASARLPLLPTRDYFAGSQRESEGPANIARVVELGAVGQAPHIPYGERVSECRGGSRSDDEIRHDQPREHRPCRL